MQSRDILLVDDNPDDVALTLRALRKTDFAIEVVVAEDGLEALDYLQATGKHEGRDLGQMPRVILLDLKMPKVDGLEVLQRIRENLRTRLLPVVILTTSNEEGDRVASYERGANSYILKPVDFTKFSETVQKLAYYWLVLNEAP